MDDSIQVGIDAKVLRERLKDSMDVPEPTIGRIMHFYSRVAKNDKFAGPSAAIIIDVFTSAYEGGTSLTLQVFGRNGTVSPAYGVRFLQEMPKDDAPANLYAIYPPRV